MSNPTAAWAKVRKDAATISREQLAYYKHERQRGECLTKWCTLQTLSLYGERVFAMVARGWLR